ncbi:MAG: DUF349 domain-containing protein, partial [Tannerella sp.]|nr:DUF349 domain-containing protein [Tannerella sp.]
TPEVVEEAPEVVEEAPEVVEEAPEAVEAAPEAVETAPEAVETAPEVVETAPEAVETTPEAVEATPEVVEAATTAPETPKQPEDVSAMSKQRLLETLQGYVDDPRKISRSDADSIRQAYYKIRRTEIDGKRYDFIEKGGSEAEFVTPEDETEAQLKSLLSQFRERKNSLELEQERDREKNLVIRQHLIERLKILTENKDDFNKNYNEFKDIQNKWKETKDVPKEHQKELIRNYQLYCERFYDIIRINAQLRDYNFKKNLEMKTAICETVERLCADKDVVSAFHQLQKLHLQWREIGPVSKDYRESIWERFKAASAIINRQHSHHFDELKSKEHANYLEKKAICEQVEAIDPEQLKSIREWDGVTKQILDLQAKWRTIGYATERHNNKIFERFRADCDSFFKQKKEFLKTERSEKDRNLEIKQKILEQAIALKESSDWKETTKAIIELQQTWKKTGPVPRRFSDEIWKQFLEACDYFFERKNKETSSKGSQEAENLHKKKSLIKKINEIDKDIDNEEALEQLHAFIAEWNTVGYVPVKEKDKTNKAFRNAIDAQFDRLKVSERDRRLQQFRSSLSEMSGSDKRLYGERDKLVRQYDRMKTDLNTYENNIGFFTVSSKGGDGLLKETNRKISRLKEDMEAVLKKIEAIDENMRDN